jgi:pimeloyl-ACP methyl ester carboxylesterase
MIWLKRISKGALALLLLIGISLFGFDRISQWVNKDDFPPPGQFVEVDGINMHYVCYGQGSPVVFFESGFGGDSFDTWNEIAKQTAKTNKSCFYDRLGMGWSGELDGQLTTAQIVDKLSQVVDEVAQGQSVVFVAHSFGGLIVRQYAKKHKSRIAGLVFADSAHDDQHGRIDEVIKPITVKSMYWLKLSAAMGLTRIKWLWDGEDARTIQLYSGVKFANNQVNYAKKGGFFTPIRNEAYDLTDIPMIVLQHDPKRFPSSPKWVKAGVVWDELQHEIADLSAHSEIITVEGAGHGMPGDKPQAIVDAVNQVLVRL